MSVVLLDTTVASLLHPRKKDDALRIRYENLIRGQVAALSFQSVAELWDWAEANRWSAPSRAGLETFLSRFLVIPYRDEMAKVWAYAMNESRLEGRRFASGDCWIAATAIYYRIPLITHDSDLLGHSIRHFEAIGCLETQ